MNAADGNRFAALSKLGADETHPFKLEGITCNPYKIALDIPIDGRDILIAINIFHIQISGCQRDQRQERCILHQRLVLAYDVQGSPHGPEILRRLRMNQVYFDRH